MNKGHKHWKLYILKLEQDKWYVGITSQSVEKRFHQHKSGFAGAKWTKVYNPIKIHDVKDLGVCDIERAQKYEGRVTREYMKEYGDNNVRGGDLTDVDEYVRRFGYFITKDNWSDIKYVLVVMVLIVAMTVYIAYFKYFNGEC